MILFRSYLVTCSVLGIILFCLQGCGGTTRPLPTPTTVPPAPQLRITNSGDTTITDLTILFPGVPSQSAATRISFGSITAGTTTSYHEVPLGVYRYAAYEYTTITGQKVTQAVTDWMGEKPMAGQQFTYRLQLNAHQPVGNQIELLEAVVDTP